MTDLDPYRETAEELFEGAPCGYLAALSDGTIVKVNQTFLSWTGYDRDSLLAGCTFQQLLTIPGQVYYDTHIAPLLQMQGFVHEVAFDLKRPNQSPLSILLNCTLKRSAEGQPLLLRLTVFDATHRRQYERELLQARRAAEQATEIERLAREEAERANRAKDDILALVSHELKTPLSAILGWTQILNRKMQGNADLAQGLEVIERNARLQSRLVDDLLDMSRVVSGKLRLEVQRVDLASAVDAAIESIRPALLARGIRLSRVLDSGVLVTGDAGRLQQVFWNLLSNAVKFTPKDGSIRVSMQKVNSSVEVSVTDSGQGMAPALVAHVFERFRQAASRGTRETGGLGLGLALVKHLVEMHGGSVEAHSEGEGHGSTFIVRLPITTTRSMMDQKSASGTRAVSSAATERAELNLRGTRVVVVDDDRDARELLWRILTDCGAEVIATASAAEAVATVERVKPHVLVSDIDLPEENGYELIRKIRMLGEDAGRVPAVALTAMSRPEDRTEALLAGFQIHLAKPVDSRELAITVASLTGRYVTPTSALP